MVVVVCVGLPGGSVHVEGSVHVGRWCRGVTHHGHVADALAPVLAVVSRIAPLVRATCRVACP
eukprot:2117410-Prymnesium_polylepis.1